jgi:hypothetical protein
VQRQISRRAREADGAVMADIFKCCLVARQANGGLGMTDRTLQVLCGYLARRGLNIKWRLDSLTTQFNYAVDAICAAGRTPGNRIDFWSEGPLFER